MVTFIVVFCVGDSSVQILTWVPMACAVMTQAHDAPTPTSCYMPVGGSFAHCHCRDIFFLSKSRPSVVVPTNHMFLP